MSSKTNSGLFSMGLSSLITSFIAPTKFLGQQPRIPWVSVGLSVLRRGVESRMLVFDIWGLNCQLIWGSGNFVVQLVSIAVQCCDVVVGRLRGWRSVGGRMHTVGVADCISWMSFVCSIVLFPWLTYLPFCASPQ